MYLDRSIIENYGISNNIGILSYVMISYDEAIKFFVKVLKKYKTYNIRIEKRIIKSK